MKTTARVLLSTLVVAALGLGPAGAQDWTIDVSALTVAGMQSDELTTDAPNQITDATANLTIHGAAGVAVDTLTAFVTVGGSLISTVALSSGNPRTGAISRDAVTTGSQLAIGTGGAGAFSPIVSYPLAVSAPPAPAPGGGAGGGGGTADVTQQLTFLCTRSQIENEMRGVGLDPANADSFYRVPRGQVGGARVADAWVVVTPLGAVLYSGLEDFDENDRLRVLVVGHPELMDKIKVSRTSAFGPVGQIRIVGSSEAQSLIQRQSLAPPPSNCDSRDFILTDFAPTEGSIGISARLSGSDDTQLASLEFNVHPLYSGMFTLGAAVSDLVDPAFQLVADGSGDQMRIQSSQVGSEEVQYALFYTPFVSGKRDLEKKIPWLRRVNPTLGIMFEDVLENAFVGVTVDLPAGLALTWGFHFREIEVLQGVSAGDVFTPPMGSTDPTLPVAREWENDTFVGVSWDLRAIAGLFGSALGGGGS